MEDVLRASLKGMAQPPSTPLAVSHQAWFEAVATAMLHSPEDCVRIAQRGLECMLDGSTYTRNGARVSLSEASTLPPRKRLRAHIVRGTAARLDVDAVAREFNALASAWVDAGMADGDVMAECGAVPASWDLRGVDFIVLGALSDDAPSRELLRLGATVLAVDAPGPRWVELEAAARASCGTLVIACQGDHDDDDDDDDVDADRRGCSLVADLPEVTIFVLQHAASAQPVLCNFVASADFPLVACADALVEHVCEARNGSALAAWSSPDEALLVGEGGELRIVERAPPSARIQGTSALTKARFGRTCGAQSSFVLKRATGGDASSLMGGQVRRWRAVVARQLGTYRWLADKRRHVVSGNVRPSGGSLLVCTLLLVHDLRRPAAAVDSPLRLFNQWGGSRL